MKKVLQLLFNKWTIGLFLIFVFSVFIIYIGSLLSIANIRPLESRLSQIICIVIIFSVWLIYRLVSIYVANKKHNSIAEDLSRNTIVEDETDNEFVIEEKDQVKQRFDQAIKQLEKSKTGMGLNFNLYQLPWYVIIGPPGSGKTTALLNSGLKFPLTDALGKQKIDGVGGTKNCEWWFTDKAILIDTAGRYVTQDSNEEIDSQGWINFLELLKKHRKRQPLNGVFVTISCADILSINENDRLKHVYTIKQRIKELNNKLGIQFPIYILVTKMDLVSGFDEYFANYDKEQRSQVWGITFDLENHENNIFDVLNAELEKLIFRLDQKKNQYIYNEKDVSKRSQIYGFPKQVQVLFEALVPFLTEIFDSTDYDEKNMLRGVYFTSGTQEGNPIDLLVKNLSNHDDYFRDVKGKSFFIKDVLNKVAFPEAAIATRDLKIERKIFILRNVLLFGSIITFLILSTGWLLSYNFNKKYINQVQKNTIELQGFVNDMPKTTEAGSHGIVNFLDDIVKISNLDDNKSFPWHEGLGLSQKPKLFNSIDAVYKDGLNKIFLERLVLEIEKLLRDNDIPMNLQYEALRVYLMLYDGSRYKAKDVIVFYNWLLKERFSTDINVDERETLDKHLNAVFSTKPTIIPIPRDDLLVKSVRENLQLNSFDTQVYDRLMELNVGQEGFSIAKAAGGYARASRIFARHSGKPITTELPAVFNKQFYQDMVRNNGFKKIVEQTIGEGWVYGNDEHNLSDFDLDTIIEDLKVRYLVAYRSAYKELINDLKIVGFISFSEAKQFLDIASSKKSPLKLFLKEFNNQTKLTPLFEELDEEINEEQSSESIGDKLSSYLKGRERSSLGDTLSTFTSKDKDIVTKEFEKIHELLSGDEGNTPIDFVIDNLENLSEVITEASYENIDGAISQSLARQVAESSESLSILANDQPDSPVKSIVVNIAGRTASLSSGGVDKKFNLTYKEEIYDFCKSSISGRYPINYLSTEDIKLNDFKQFFSYGGMMDSFFNNHLKKFVDTSTSPSKVRDTKQTISFSKNVIRQFQSAHIIKKTFFKNGSNEFNFDAVIRPIEMDAAISKFRMDIAGQKIIYEHGPTQTSQLSWPGTLIGEDVRVQMTGSVSKLLVTKGDWSWLRMLDKINVVLLNETEFKLDFPAANGVYASFNLSANSNNNPYKIKQRISFSCAENLTR